MAESCRHCISDRPLRQVMKGVRVAPAAQMDINYTPVRFEKYLVGGVIALGGVGSGRQEG